MGFLGGSPSVSTPAKGNLEDEKRKAAKARTALYSTEGGAEGEEVEEVKKRQTLLGN